MSEVVVQARVNLDTSGLDAQAAAAGQRVGAGISDGIARSKSDLLRDLAEIRAGLQTTTAVEGQAAQGAQQMAREFTRAGRELQTAANGLRYWVDDAGRARDATGRLLQAVELAEAGLDDLTRAARGAGQQINLMDGLVQGVAFSLTNALGNAAQSTVRQVQGLVQGFMDLDGEIRKAAAAAGEDGAYQRLGRVIDQVGIEASGTTIQVAQMATSLSRAGFSVREIEEALPGVIRGAEATGTGFESMGSIAGNTLRGMGLETRETARVIDVLVNTANSSNASIEGLGYTMQYSAPIAKALGVSLEDVAAAAGLMANAGIDGSVAGTGLRTGLQRLQQAATGASGATMGLGHGQEKLAKSMRILGADITKQDGTLKSLDQVLISLKRNFERFDVPTKVRLSEAIFGEESGSKFLAALNQSETAILKMFRDINNSSGATDVARGKMQGLGLATLQLTGTMDSLGVTLGGVAGTALYPVVNLLNGLLGAVAALPNEVKTAAGAVVLLGGAYVSAIVAAKGFALAVTMAGGWPVVTANVSKLAAALTGPLVTGYRAATAAAQGFTVSGLLVTGAGVLRVAGAVLLLTARLALLVGAFMVIGTIGSAVMGKVAEMTASAADRQQRELDELQKRVGRVRQLIEDRKRYGLDTSAAEQQLRQLELRALKLRDLLQGTGGTRKEIEQTRLEADKAIRQQEGEFGPGRVPTTNLRATSARVRRAAAEFALRAQDSIIGDSAIYRPGMKTPMEQSAAVNDAQKALLNARKQLESLRVQQINLPISAEVKRNEINEKIAALQRDLKRKEQMLTIQSELALIPSGIAAANLDARAMPDAQSRAQAVLERDTLEARQRELEANLRILQSGRDINGELKRELDQSQKIVAERTAQLDVEDARLALVRTQQETSILRMQRDGQISPAAADETRSANAISNLQKEIELTKQRIQLLDMDPSLTDRAIAEQRTKLTAQIAQKEGEIYKTQTEAVQKRIAAEREVLQLQTTTQTRSLDITQQEAELGQKRLSAQLQFGQSLLNLAEAQSQLRQSEFGISAARNTTAIATAERELEAARQRGASTSELAGRERDIAALRAGGQQIERDRAVATLRDMEARQQIENQILVLKQQQQVAEQEMAVIAAQRGRLQAQGQLNQAQQALSDAIRRGASSDEINALRDSVKLAQSGVNLSEQQVQFEDQRLLRLGRILELERQINATKQQTQTNQARAQAISIGAARFTGGPVVPGGSYVINDGPGGRSLGQESFLSRSGDLALLNRPANSLWSPPAPGVVLPAVTTSQLKAQGAFSGGRAARGTDPVGRSAVAVETPGLERLAQEMGNLRAAIAGLIRKDWSVHVQGSAGSVYARSLPALS